jgi:hypothetical protein
MIIKNYSRRFTQLVLTALSLIIVVVYIAILTINPGAKLASANHDGKTQYACQSNPQVCGANEQYCENSTNGIRRSFIVTKYAGSCDPTNGEHDSNGCIYLYRIEEGTSQPLFCSERDQGTPPAACVKDQVVGTRDVCNGSQLCTVNIHTRADCSRYDGGFYNCRNVAGQCGVSTSQISQNCFVCDTASDGKSRFRSTAASNCNDQKPVCDSSKTDQGACRSSSNLDGTLCGPQPTQQVVTQTVVVTPPPTSPPTSPSQQSSQSVTTVVREVVQPNVQVDNRSESRSTNQNVNINSQSQSQSQTVNLTGYSPSGGTVYTNPTTHYVTYARPADRPRPTAYSVPTATRAPSTTYYSNPKGGVYSQPGVTYVAPSNVYELPRTGLPLIAWGVAALLPFGLKLRRFGRGQQNGSTPHTLWEKRQFRRPEETG